MRTLINGGHQCEHTASPRCIKCAGSDQSTFKRLALATGITISNKVRRSNHTTYLAVSSAVARLHRDAGLALDIQVVPNFIDLPTSPIAPIETGGTILFVGPSNKAKGLDVLVAAHQRLIKQGHQTVLNHVGGTRIQHDSLFSRSGRLEGQELRGAFDSATVVVVPSIWEEPCPTVALEAMAAGRGVIGSAVGGTNGHR